MLAEPSQMLHTERRKLVRKTGIEWIGEFRAAVMHPRPDNLDVVLLSCVHHWVKMAELIVARLRLTEMPSHVFAGPPKPQAGKECVVLGCLAVELGGCNEV